MSPGEGATSPPPPARGQSALPDGIEWRFSRSVLAYGVRFAVRANDSSIAEEILSNLPPNAELEDFRATDRVYSLVVEERDRSGGPRTSLYVDAAPLARRAPQAAALRAFEADARIHVAEMAPDRVFVHAGVVAWQGRGILLPGRSFTGKTTLVAALVRAGAEYYSDEYAVLDSDGCVHAYPRPLSIRQAGGQATTKCRVDALGGRAGWLPVPVGLVLVSRFRSGGTWQPERLSPGAGALALLANTVAARRIPKIVLATLRRIVSAAPAIASERGEAASVVEPILGLATQTRTVTHLGKER